MDKKVRKVRGFANIRYNAKITENPKNDVFGKIMLNLKFSQNLTKKGLLKRGISTCPKKLK